MRTKKTKVQKEFVAKYKIKGQDNWHCFPFWAKDSKEAQKIWESDYKYEWPSMDYELEELKSSNCERKNAK